MSKKDPFDRLLNFDIDDIIDDIDDKISNAMSRLDERMDDLDRSLANIGTKSSIGRHYDNIKIRTGDKSTVRVGNGSIGKKSHKLKFVHDGNEISVRYNTSNDYQMQTFGNVDRGVLQAVKHAIQSDIKERKTVSNVRKKTKKDSTMVDDTVDPPKRRSASTFPPEHQIGTELYNLEDDSLIEVRERSALGQIFHSKPAFIVTIDGKEVDMRNFNHDCAFLSIRDVFRDPERNNKVVNFFQTVLEELKELGILPEELESSYNDFQERKKKAPPQASVSSQT